MYITVDATPHVHIIKHLQLICKHGTENCKVLFVCSSRMRVHFSDGVGVKEPSDDDGISAQQHTI